MPGELNGDARFFPAYFVHVLSIVALFFCFPTLYMFTPRPHAEPLFLAANAKSCIG